MKEVIFNHREVQGLPLLLQDHTFLVELLDLSGELLDSLVAGCGGHTSCLKGMEVPV